MENQSKKKFHTIGQNITVGIEDVGDDLMRNILSRLPTLSFASAACVSRSWNSLCNRILSAPKLSSAISFNSSLEDAVREVVDKVLLEPIRPHFALASVGPSFSLQNAHQLVVAKFGTGIPIITNVSEGLIGTDALTNGFLEDLWVITDESDTEDGDPENLVNHGILLTVGFLPGLKAEIIPLFSQDKGAQKALIDKFVMDIKGCSTAISDSESPAGILLFADCNMDMNPVLQKMEFSFSPDTVIVGDSGSRFLYSDGINTTMRGSETTSAVALLFARDKNKPACIGETTFHLMSSAGLTPVGPTYKAVSVKSFATSTSLTASRETLHEHLDGQTILDEIYDELGDRIQCSFYIGVTKRRNCSVGREKVRRMRFLEFHEVISGNEEYLTVESGGIKTGDPFRFYVSCSKAAVSSLQKTSDKLKQMKRDSKAMDNHLNDKSEVFGGIIFSCCGRGNSYFEKRGIDSSIFVDNFPGIPFGGTYCAGEIGRMNLSLYDEDNEEGKSISCFKHFYSAFYLVMSYSPPPPEH